MEHPDLNGRAVSLTKGSWGLPSSLRSSRSPLSFSHFVHRGRIFPSTLIYRFFIIFFASLFPPYWFWKEIYIVARFSMLKISFTLLLWRTFFLLYKGMTIGFGKWCRIIIYLMNVIYRWRGCTPIYFPQIFKSVIAINMVCMRNKFCWTTVIEYRKIFEWEFAN